MKTIVLLVTVVAFLTCAPVVADEQWAIEGYGDDVQMKPKYDYDYSRRYKGYMDEDGYTRLRNPYTGDTVRGYIDDDGYGRLRDSDGNTWRVRPRP